MAHQAQRDFIDSVKTLFPAAFRGQRVLEVGSLDINGSVRCHFAGCDYAGIDVAPGPGVDIVCQGQDFGADDATFDVVLSCEAMEHNPYWKETFANMLRLCRPGGMLLMTCATSGRPEHGTRRTDSYASPLTVAIGWDYYRNLTEADFRQAIDLPRFLSRWCFVTDYLASDLYFVGIRAGGAQGGDIAGKLRRLQRRYAVRNLRWRAARKRVLLSLLGERHYLRLPALSPASAVLAFGALRRRVGLTARSPGAYGSRDGSPDGD